mmetsp:Transcript_2923/g.7846  ORF Transcript_2923/g.7846 Transcript_2923/m.7846 type:complete len:309 (+) Transcript_2923:1164-2090(+)
MRPSGPRGMASSHTKPAAGSSAARSIASFVFHGRFLTITRHFFTRAPSPATWRAQSTTGSAAAAAAVAAASLASAPPSPPSSSPCSCSAPLLFFFFFDLSFLPFVAPGTAGCTLLPCSFATASDASRTDAYTTTATPPAQPSAASFALDTRSTGAGSITSCTVPASRAAASAAAATAGVRLPIATARRSLCLSDVSPAEGKGAARGAARGAAAAVAAVLALRGAAAASNLCAAADTVAPTPPSPSSACPSASSSAGAAFASALALPTCRFLRSSMGARLSASSTCSFRPPICFPLSSSAARCASSASA